MGLNPGYLLTSFLLYPVLWEEFEKRDKIFFDLPERRFEPRIYEQIPAQNLNFEGD